MTEILTKRQWEGSRTMTYSARSGSRAFIAGLATLALTVGGALAAPAPASLPVAQGLAPAPGKRVIEDFTLPGSLGDKRVDVFVQLTEPAVAEVVAKSASGRPSAERQRTVAKIAADQQAEFVTRLNGLNVTEEIEVKRRYQVAANGVKLNLRLSDVPKLRALDGVRSVGLEPEVELHLEHSVPWINAPAVWERYGTGEGVTVAVIDTGVDYTHAVFGGEGTEAAYNAAAGDPTAIEEGTFPSGRVIGGFDFAGTHCPGSDAPDAPDEVQPDPDPIPGGVAGEVSAAASHGTHVASIAAGSEVAGEVGAGVAPSANILALKVFDDSGEGSACGDIVSAIEFATDPDQDGVMNDFADVINISLGSPFGSPNSGLAIASANVTEAGVIVVASAGNSGEVPYITGEPATGDKVISVGASTSGGRPDVEAPAVEVVSADDTVDELVRAVEGAGPVTLEDSGEIRGDLVPADPLNGCESLANDFAGNIALVQRGECFFLDKYLNAQAAGAAAIVVFNNDQEDPDPIIMGGLDDPDIAIPGVMIGTDDGNAFLDAIEAEGKMLTAAIGPEITVDVAPPTPDLMTGFSSRGPARGGSQLKPDITAPGGSGAVAAGILGAFAGTGTGPLKLAGTSMSSPHVAGLAALMREQMPLTSPEKVKAILQNTAQKLYEDGTPDSAPFPLTLQGVGRVDAEAAVGTTGFVLPGAVSFGRVEPRQAMFRDVRFTTVRNRLESPRTFEVTHEPGQTVDGVTFSAPETVELDGKSSASFAIRLEVDTSSVTPDPGNFSQREADGWFVLDDGEQQFRVGYTAVIDPAADAFAGRAGKSTVALNNPGVSASAAQGFTLAGFGSANVDDSRFAIEATGFRQAVCGFCEGTPPLIQFGISTDSPWESMSTVRADLVIDVNEDNVPDALVIVADAGLLQNGSVTASSGQLVSAVVDLTAAQPSLETQFVASGDYHDSSAFFSVFRDRADGGFMPEGDSSFNYTLWLSDARFSGFSLSTLAQFGLADVQQGQVRLDRDIAAIADAESLVTGGSTVEVTPGDEGFMLWLFPNNRGGSQSSIVSTDKSLKLSDFLSH